jgi:hypothetical protein
VTSFSKGLDSVVPGQALIASVEEPGGNLDVETFSSGVSGTKLDREPARVVKRGCSFSYQQLGAFSAAGYTNAPLGSLRAPGVSHEVDNWDPVRQQVVRYDSTVAAPPHGFGAHDGATLVARQCFHLLNSRPECLSSSVVRIISEGRVPPKSIGGRHRVSGLHLACESVGKAHEKGRRSVGL